MSDLDAKLHQERSTPGRARCSLAQLLERYGLLQVHGDEAELLTMQKVESWRRVSGRGLQSTWELQQTH